MGCALVKLDCVGLPPLADDRDLPGAPLMDVVAGRTGPRTIISEYHAAGASAAVFMIRLGAFKYVHYVGMPPQLFHLATDPHETRDLGQDTAYRGVIAEAEAALRDIVDPEAADRQARADQAAKIAELGGREAILARGAFGYSPVPGTKPVYTR